MSRDLSSIDTDKLMELTLKATKSDESLKTWIVFTSPEPEKDLFDRLLNEDSWEA